MREKRCMLKCAKESEVLFTIPNKEEIFKLWQKACEGHVHITRGRYIFSNHFKEDDIIRKRFLTWGENIIGVSEFQKPRLRLGAVPTLFKKEEPQLPEVVDNNGSPPNVPENQESNLASPLTNYELCFGKTNTINIPQGWNRSTSISKPQFVMYFQLLANVSETVISNNIFPVFGKTVIIDRNSHVQCSYLGKLIPINIIYSGDYNCESEVSVEQLESIIYQFDKKRVCNRVNINKRKVMYKTQVTYIDHLNKWRHNNCKIIIQETEQICVSCKTINHDFNNNKNRRLLKPVKRVCLKVTPSKKDKLKLIRTRKQICHQNNL